MGVFNLYLNAPFVENKLPWFYIWSANMKNIN